MSGRLAVWAGDNGFWGGGFGDDFLFARWILLARERVGALTLAVLPSLVEFFRGQFEGVDVCGYDEVGSYDRWASLLTLPRLLGTRTLADLPGTPYLRAATTFRQLPGAFRVGIAWATKDPLRATSLAGWAPVLEVPGATFYSFQVFDHPLFGDSTELHRLAPHVQDLAPKLVSWSDTAAALTQMDLVIAIDWSVTNLAGAMGLPAWVCLWPAAEWRWLLEPEWTPWYATARLFRQERVGDWSPVFAEVAAELLQIVAARQDNPSSYLTPESSMPLH
jgi:hypothetical protein